MNGGCTVLILVAQDVDPLCGLEILCSMLRSDMIGFSLVPVNGYEDIQRIGQERLGPNSEVRSIIMINCGAIVNSKAMIPFPLHVKCLVIDSHRPIHLSNVYDAEQVIVLDDEAISIQEMPEYGSDIEREEHEDDDDGDESSSESEPEDAEAQSLNAEEGTDHQPEDDNEQPEEESNRETAKVEEMTEQEKPEPEEMTEEEPEMTSKAARA